MLQFIYGTRDGIHIINLEHTLVYLRRASKVVYNVASQGGNIVFVGTKPSLHKLVVDVATNSNQYYITHWLGGLMTNKERVLRRSVGYDPDKVSQSLSSVNLELDEQDRNEVVKMLDKQPFVHKPDLLVLLDYPNTQWAVHEANYSKIPVIALCDTDCDPARVQYPIPGNDDSFSGVELIARVLGRASKQGHLEFVGKSSSEY
jgi:small subunit ribosomal protein S2